MRFRLTRSRSTQLAPATSGSPPAPAPIRRATGVHTTMRGEEAVLLDVEGQRYYTLNAVGARIWALLDGAPTEAAIVDVLADEYALPAPDGRAMLAGDVRALLAALRAAGLITGGRDR